MKSSGQKEESGDKKKYVFFSDPDVIAKRAETSAIAAQITRDAQWQTSDKQSDNQQVPTLGRKNLENLLSYHPVQPYPFTFISAVKQKLALGDRTDINTKKYNPSSQSKSSLTSSVLKTNSTQNLYQIVQKMDFIRPLKVPDLKISPKTLDFSSRENSVSKELSSKSEIAAKEFAHDKSDKTLRLDRVQRKLDFSSDGSSIINSESIEPLKAPNVSIASNLSKKKEHVRDSSREKENRSKRLKKDDSSCTKRDEFAQDQVKRSRSPRRISRKDAIDMSNIRLSLPKNDRPFHTAKNNDYPSTKSKDKNFVMSSVKKDNDKRQRSFNVQSVELTRENLESKCRMSSNEPPVFPSWKVPDKVTLRDNNIGILSNIAENKSKDVCHSKQRPDIEDSKHKSDSDNRQLKQDKSNTIHKEQAKRVSDKNKTSNNKIEGTLHSIDSELSENIGTVSETNSSKNRVNVYPAGSAQSSKSKDSETTAESKQSTNSARSAKTLESFKCKEHSAAQSAGTSTKNDEESYLQSTITTKESNTNDDSNDVDISTLPDTLFDPRRISFRDGYAPQDFHNLTTPEKMNLMVRSKRRKWIQNSDSEADARCPKHKPIIKSEQEQSEIQLMHPTALHMQFQAELHLYDSYNESLRQIMDVEKCLYNTNREQEQKNLQKVNEKDEELGKIVQTGEDRAAAAVDNDAVGKTVWNPLDYTKKDIAETWRSSDEAHFNREHYTSTNQGNTDESGINYGKFSKAVVKVAEVQTQTVNDMATQTDISAKKRDTQKQLLEVHTEAACERSLSRETEVPQLSLDSAEQHEDLDQIEKMSLPNKIRTMSEISLHETTSSIKTETGTEISISTRDVTCSFNQYLDLEIAQLIRDENQRCNKIEELFKSREKTLNDKTKKLMQLEEQKRVLKDTGQDSRSVKKKQRALILKLQQEKDEISRLKYLYVITSQERKLMLQKQRNMFNPQISTKNILTKLKRSADSQSPRRLSGPMKGYDIRSNSSMSSLIDSDKSQHDQSQVDPRLQTPKSFRSIFLNSTKECNTSATKFDDPAESKKLEKNPAKSQKKGDMSKYELRSRKYDEKMPRADILRNKQNQLDMESKRIQGHPMKIKRLLENQEVIGVPQSSKLELNVSLPDYVKSESDTLVEELSKRSRTVSQVADPSVQTATILTEKDSTSNIVTANSESIEEEINTIIQDTISKTTKSSQVSESMLQTNSSKSSKKIDKSVTSDKDVSKKLQYSTELKTSSKRKSSKYQKTKSSSNTLTENILQSKSSSHISEELIKHHDKRTKVENESSQLDINNESSYESKENTYSQVLNRKVDNDESSSRNERSVQNVSTSQVDTFAISHHSSGDSEKNLSKSVVVRSKDRDFEQILSARETALTSRKNCVEEWMAWHARLRAEEDRVSRMEQAAFKLVAAASNVLSQQERGLCSFIDTTLSSDTSDVEGRIGLLTEKLAERRIEMARLKREAKRQAKKQLRALEANLLNQIKRYDTTIHEMRKKLETKKGIKETDKLAIEPKSLADFKVPEIPLKRIQDIYKSSDLLRSRSESDLLATKNQQKDLLKIVTPIAYDNKRERDTLQKSAKSTDIKSTSATRLKSITDINHSSQTILDEYTEAYDKIPTVTSVSLASHSALSGKHALSIEKQIDVKQSSVSRDAENSEKNLSTVRSELEVPTISDASIKSTDNRPISKTDQSKILTIQSEMQEDVGYSKSIPSKSNYSVENITRITDSNILTYSRKLDYLQLNNKNLSEDISSIENDIKALSEIMSRLSNESNEKSKADNDERNTSQDISEIISKSVFSDKISNIANDEKQAISHEKEINTDSLSGSANDRKSKSPNDSSRGSYVSDKINNEVSATIPEEASILSNSARIEIDYEAKSKEIMNEIEKSIISEHIKETLDDYNTSLENENEELLNELISELDVKSISEILSKVSESRRSLDLATNVTTEIVSDAKKDRNVAEILEAEAITDAKPLKNFDEDIQTPALDETVNSVALASKADRNQSHTISAGNISQDKDDWTTSDSFEVPQDEISTGDREEFEKSQSRLDDSSSNFLEKDVSAFIPKGESTKVEMHNVTIDNTLVESHTKTNDELDDILDIISRENNQEKNIFNNENEKRDVLSDSMAELLDKVKDFAENDEKIEDNHFGEILQAAGESDDKPVVNINLRVEIDNEESPRETVSEAQEIIITELDSESIEDNVLSELEIDAKIELAEEEEPAATSNVNEGRDYYVVEETDMPVEIKECLESILEQDSSDGEQLDNLVEVAESGLDTVEKLVAPSRDSPDLIIDNATPVQSEEAKESADGTVEQNDEIVITSAPIIANLNKTFEIFKDPEYEDISEESLEVSEILDKNDLSKAGVAKKSASLPEKYQAVQKSVEVLRILDEISQKSSPDSISNSQKSEKDARSAQSPTEEISELLGAEVSAEDDSSSPEMNRITKDKRDESGNRSLEGAELHDRVEAGGVDLSEEKSPVPLRLDEHNRDDKPSQIIYELRERVSQLQEQDVSSESSEAGDTPRGVSEIEMDSPRDFNDSRLDMDILDDDLLSGTKSANQSVDVKSNFHSASIVATSEKDIEAMIDKIKASLGQPGLEVSELEAKLLRIEQLQIELEIKKLEAEEVSYYVREIPNKPPPPYTPPGDSRLPSSLGSPSLVTAVTPTNVEELTLFTEKATTLIYNAKLAGDDIASLEAPPEIYDLTKDKNEAVRKDKRIYNTFLFDLCKETIVEVYRAEYEKPGPSWTKPNVKTKPTMKMPKTVDELIEYVNKEVATLFGFKTKLQRENMVMRWSRKRRDRVDELLAREAQAEEDEWTKFHHDELAVKNGLTIAILDTLMMETANVVKTAYGKKRRMMV
ncbi:LOW QUALITY PROTEIN: fap1 adhesin [Linepithema humile]|uniref:LOW QUALITY PROTEIN: fap1 adhesin n=1 Tax=Linepithema humile TaxID=83485 RepID=UPI00351F73E8